MIKKKAFQYPHIIAALVLAGHTQDEAISAIKAHIEENQHLAMDSIKRSGGTKCAIETAISYRRLLLKNKIIV